MQPQNDVHESRISSKRRSDNWNNFASKCSVLSLRSILLIYLMKLPTFSHFKIGIKNGFDVLIILYHQLWYIHSMHTMHCKWSVTRSMAIYYPAMLRHRILVEMVYSPLLTMEIQGSRTPTGLFHLFGWPTDLGINSSCFGCVSLLFHWGFIVSRLCWFYVVQKSINDQP